MIKVTIDYHKHGSKEKTGTIAELIIVNTGTGTWDDGDYKACLLSPDGITFKTCEVKGFPRTQKRAWHLHREVMNNLLNAEQVHEEGNKNGNKRQKKRTCKNF